MQNSLGTLCDFHVLDDKLLTYVSIINSIVIYLFIEICTRVSLFFPCIFVSVEKKLLILNTAFNIGKRVDVPKRRCIKNNITLFGQEGVTS